MKNILTHIGVAAIAIVATLLFMRGCTETRVVTETIVECHVDTVFTVDTFEYTRVIRETLRDTVERVVYLDTTQTSEDMLTYEEHYQDSSYSVYGNIFYTGHIERHDQMFVQNKEQITFIPTTRTIFKTRDHIVLKDNDKPKVYMGLYSTFNTLTPQQAGISIAYQDNRHRMYTIGKDLLSVEQWSVDIKIPVIWSRK